MEIEDIKPIGKVIQTHHDFGTIESEVIQGITMLDVGTKLYTDEQMQEYAKAQVRDALEIYGATTAFSNDGKFRPLTSPQLDHAVARMFGEL